MNTTQLVQQLKAELQAVRWEESPQQLVFGPHGVVITAGTAPNFGAHPVPFPFVMLSPGTFTADENDPDLIRQQFSAVTVAEVYGDDIGEVAVIGGALGSNQSAGAGVLELDARVAAAIGNLTGFDGAPIQVSSSSSGAVIADEGVNVAYSETIFEAVCTRRKVYAPVQELTNSGSAWSWEGTEARSRFDFLSFTLAYKTGATPARSVTDVDGVIATGITTDATTHTPVAGRAYSVFALYGDRGALQGASDGDLVGAYLTT